MKILDVQWDDDNFTEINTHGVTIKEFEEICYGLHFSKPDSPITKGGKQRYPSGKKRFILQGRTSGNKYLDVIIEQLYDSYYRAVTAYIMSDKYKAICAERISNIERHRSENKYEENHRTEE